MYKRIISLFITAILLSSTLTTCTISDGGTLATGASNSPNNPTVSVSASQADSLTTVTQNILPSDNIENTSVNDKYYAFIERWKLSGLLPECGTITTEDQEDFIKYFQQFDDVTRNYIMLLLQGIAAGTITLGYGGDDNGINDHKYGVYLHYCALCLYDMNQDGFPELILMTGGCEAAYLYTVYTIVDGKLIDCGELSGGHTVLYTNGSGRFVRYESHMRLYDIDVSTLEGTTLKTQEIAAGELDNSKEEQYPDLDRFGYGDYNQSMTLSGIPTLFLAPEG